MEDLQYVLSEDQIRMLFARGKALDPEDDSIPECDDEEFAELMLDWLECSPEQVARRSVFQDVFCDQCSVYSRATCGMRCTLLDPDSATVGESLVLLPFEPGGRRLR